MVPWLKQKDLGGEPGLELLCGVNQNLLGRSLAGFRKAGVQKLDKAETVRLLELQRPG